jgi:hypothetical protein
MAAHRRPAQDDALARGEADTRRLLLVDWLDHADVADPKVQRRIALAWKGAKLDADHTDVDLVCAAFVDAVERAADERAKRQLSDVSAVLLATNNLSAATGARYAERVSRSQWLACLDVARRAGRPKGSRKNDDGTTTKAKRDVYADAISSALDMKVDADVIKRARKKVGRRKV